MLANGLHNDERCLQSDADLAAQDVVCDQLFSGILNFWLLVTTATRTQCLPLNLSPLLSPPLLLLLLLTHTLSLFPPFLNFFFLLNLLNLSLSVSVLRTLCPPTFSYSHPLSGLRGGGGGAGSWTEMEGKVAEKQGESVSESDTK